MDLKPFEPNQEMISLLREEGNLHLFLDEQGNPSFNNAIGTTATAARGAIIWLIRWNMWAVGTPFPCEKFSECLQTDLLISKELADLYAILIENRLNQGLIPVGELRQIASKRTMLKPRPRGNSSELVDKTEETWEKYTSSQKE